MESLQEALAQALAHRDRINAPPPADVQPTDTAPDKEDGAE